MTADEIDLYKDIVKIGIPALLGFLSGLIPYLIEKKKATVLETVEKYKNKAEITQQFVHSTSKYVGSASAYISSLLSMKMNDDEVWAKKVLEYGEAFYKYQEHRSKSKILAGLLGNEDVLKKMIDYDNSITEVVNLHADFRCLDEEASKEAITKMKEYEKNMLASFATLL